MATPLLTRDPRFIAGRQIVGEEGAVAIFATLLESVQLRVEAGDTDPIETAPGYYEYGNALLRLWHRQQQSSTMIDDDDPNDNNDGDEGKNHDDRDDGKDGDDVNHNNKNNKKNDPREAAARAAEARMKQQEQLAKAETTEGMMTIPAIMDKQERGPPETTSSSSNGPAASMIKAEEHEIIEERGSGSSVGRCEDNDDDDAEDLVLALETMETAFAIMDEYLDDDRDELHQEQQQESPTPPPPLPPQGGASAPSACNNEKKKETKKIMKKYNTWVLSQMPRVLTGMGDVLVELKRPADATAAYLQALDYRTAEVVEAAAASDNIKNGEENKGLDQLTRRRKLVEANILIVEALLLAPPDQDLVTTESQAVLVPAGGIGEYAQGYYDQARNELQETLLLMGQLVAAASAARGSGHVGDDDDLNTEKENVSHAATLVMAAGTALLDYMRAEQDQQQSTASDDNGPPKKKAKQQRP
jgi:hypothetical protein